MSVANQRLSLYSACAEPIRGNGRYALAWLLAAVYCAISTATRVVLLLKTLSAGQITPADVPLILLAGLGYDLVLSLYLCAPLVLYLLALPRAWYRRPVQRALVWTLFVLTLYALIYLAAVEYFFFDEFNARFNFIAFEYLIYPHEIFVNIWQSYPVGRALAASGIATALLVAVLKSRISAALADTSRIRDRIGLPAALVAALFVVHGTVSIDTGRIHNNRVANELTANGIYSFFHAATNSHLDYTQFYVTLTADEAAVRARRLVAQPNVTFLPGTNNPLARHVKYPGAPKPLHVIVLLEESFGAEFVGAYGDRRGLTPSLDRIAAEGLVFTQTYASGTRTVRGMEAVTASFPPVPAESIVKRPHNEGMFNWSTVMREHGYSPTFIYGGFGTFDNMNYFFANNGYRVIDRMAMDKPKFSNIWGVSDEDLFRNALKVFDEQHARGERVFSVVMTTSNHQPYTFPDGVAGVKPEGGGREAGVRYADYAIGRFVEELKTRPYFEDTMVVIVADHGARVYGKEDIPLPTYEIPFIVYSPRHIAPRRVDTLTSQLDVAPTILGLLNVSYDSTFFGRDALADSGHLALLNHNRDIALYRDGTLSELSFRKAQRTLAYDPQTRAQSPVAADGEGLKDAASVFQLAYTLYTERNYRVR